LASRSLILAQQPPNSAFQSIDDILLHQVATLAAAASAPPHRCPAQESAITVFRASFATRASNAEESALL
jgi:hypothetical protein